MESQSKNYKVLNIDNARMHWLICQLQYVCVIVKTSSQNYLHLSIFNFPPQTMRSTTMYGSRTIKQVSECGLVREREWASH